MPVKSITFIRVRYAETDSMRVAYHGSYLPWFEVGRTDLIRQLGYPYKKLESEGIFMPVIEVTCQYLKSVHYDDELTLESWLSEQESVRVRIEYNMKREKDIVARGHTIHAFTDLHSRPTRPPKEFITKLRAGL